MIFHWSSLTGMIERRGKRTRSKFFNFALAFISASVTGRASGVIDYRARIHPFVRRRVVRVLGHGTVGKPSRSLLAKELQTESAHRLQFAVKLAPGLLRRQALEKIRQLDSATHNRIGLPPSKMLVNVQAVIGVVETFHRVGGT